MLKYVLLGTILRAGAGCTVHFPSVADGIPGSGKAKTETRALAAFSGVSVEGSMEVNWQPGAKAQATITADDNLLELLETKVENGTLKIRFKESVYSKVNPKISIQSPAIKAVSMAGSGSFAGTAIQAATFSCSLTGSGELELSGNVDRLSASVTGSGDANLKNLKSSSVTASVTGSGDLTLNVSNALIASVMGSGSINYVGSPKVTQSVQGSGDVSSIR